MIENCIVFLFLAIGAIYDLKSKYIPKRYLFIGGICAITYLIFVSINEKSPESIINAVIGIIPGLVSLFFAFVTKEQIGFGDGWVIFISGIFLGIKKMCGTIFIAFMFLTVVAIILLITHRAKRKSTVPFIPFLLIGQIVILCIGGTYE